MKLQAQVLEKLRGGLIVSCQARKGSPVYGPRFMAAFAQCAEMAGAVGFRANGGADVRAIRRVSHLPIIGINKRRDPRWQAYITPTVAVAREVARAGAEIIAIDATHRTRKGGLSPEALIAAIKKNMRCLVMADIDSIEEGVAAVNAGADIVATTMAGYTAARTATNGPDLELLCELADRVQVPLICEGRIHTPEDVTAAFAAGAYAVVVGTAITNPIWLTQIFARATPRGVKEVNL